MRTLTKEEKKFRDKCAMAAMQAMIVNERMRRNVDNMTRTSKEFNEMISESSFTIADAMLAQREKPITLI